VVRGTNSILPTKNNSSNNPPLEFVARAKWLYYAAAGATAIAGILHLSLGPGMLGFNANTGVFFIVAGIAQLFWVIPMIRRWGRPWYLVGIGGTAVLMAMYFITRMPGNPITGRGAPVNAMGAATEVAEAAFIGLTVAILVVMERRRVA
jgi:hypothetical protein